MPSNKISVPVLWNAAGSFLNGSLMGVSVEAYVIGISPMPEGPEIPGSTTPVTYADTLAIKDDSLGVLYLSMTLEEWRAAAAIPCQVGCGGEGSLTLGDPVNGASGGGLLYANDVGALAQSPIAPDTIIADGSLAGGDLDGTYPNPTLAAIVSPGTVGDATRVARITVDAKGRVTAASAVTISGVAPGGSAGGDLAGTYPSPSLATSGVSAGTYGSATQVPVITIDAKGRATAVSNATITGSGGVTVGASVSGGAASRLLFEGSTNLVAESTSLTYDLFTLSLAGNLAVTGVGTITTNALAATSTAGLTLDNTTAATSGTKNQYPPTINLLGRQWNNSASVTTGFRISKTSTNQVTTLRPSLLIDYTLDNTTWINFLSIDINRASTGTAITITGLIQNTGAINAGSSLSAGTSIQATTFIAGHGLIQSISTQTTTYNVLVTDYTILCDTTSGGFTVTLPDATTNSGQIFNIKKIAAANTLTIATSAGNIDGGATVSVTTNYQNTCVQSNGTQYYII